MRIANQLFATNSYYQMHRGNLENSMRRLSSGDRAAVAGDILSTDLTLSERLRSQIEKSRASLESVQRQMMLSNMGDSALSSMEAILREMSELAIGAQVPMSDSDRESLDDAYQTLKNSLKVYAETKEGDNQLASRNVISSFNSNDNQLHYWNTDGTKEAELPSTFLSTATDVSGTFIGFNANRSFTFDDEGNSLYYVGETAAGSGAYTINRYDLDSKTVSTGASIADDSFLYIDENGAVYVRDDTDISLVDAQNLTTGTTYTNTAVDNTQFTVYEDVITYIQGNSTVAKFTIGIGQTATPSVSVTTSPENAAEDLMGGAASDVHAFSGTGTFVADLFLTDNTIRISNLDTDQDTQISLAVGEVITELAFSKDGTELYALGSTSNAVHKIEISMEYSTGALTATSAGIVIQGEETGDLAGLSTGGMNPSTNYQIALSTGSSVINSNSFVDAGLYSLGLADTDITSVANATAAESRLETAQIRLGAARSTLAGISSRLSMQLDQHQSYIASAQDLEEQIRNIDVAEETAIMAALRLHTEVSLSVFSQNNLMAQQVLRTLLNL